MVVITPPPPTLSAENISVFYVVDELLSRSPIVLFYGPSATTTANAAASRIQSHIFTPAGLVSYPRLAISPSSSFYAAVNCLPRDEQGDEICRGLAFSLYKYFAELPESVKQAWQALPNPIGRLPSAPRLFSDNHAAILAAKMIKVDNVDDVIRDVRQALAERTLSWIDMDVVMPPGSMKDVGANTRESLDLTDEELLRHRFGRYAQLVTLFGEAAFLPTSKLRRAPSKPGMDRSPVFSRKQKENLRREMCELLDTEESYVGKTWGLLHTVAQDFRLRARSKSPDSNSPGEQALEGLFPPSLDRIVIANSGYLDAMRKLLEDTENDAIQDIQETVDDNAPYSGPLKDQDLTGALDLAKCMVEWFPKFSECYPEYIAAHANFTHHLKTLMRGTSSSFSKRVQDHGEQQLMSMLIEPVQRLPRYTLYIDNIIKQLPTKHPAVRQFLKARDIISEICSRESASIGLNQTLEELRRLVTSVPLDLPIKGRFITAVDVINLAPPYRSELGLKSHPGIFLLFTDYIVALRKRSRGVMTANSLKTKLENPGLMVPDSAEGSGLQLDFLKLYPLHSVDITEMDGGRRIHLLHSPIASSKPGTPNIPGSSDRYSHHSSNVVVYQLSGSYEGKATRLLEEITRARVESRFSEPERESPHWEVRSTSTADLHVFSAFFEDGKREFKNARGPPATVRVVIDPGRHGTMEVHPGDEGVDILVSLTVLNEGESLYRLEVQGSGRSEGTRDHLRANELMPVLVKRVSNLRQIRARIRNPALTLPLLLRNQHILQSLKIRSADIDDEEETAKEKPRAPSPVKALSALFGGAMSRDPSPKKHKTTPSLNMTDIPKMPFPPGSSSSNMSSRPQSRDMLSADMSYKPTVGIKFPAGPEDSISRLEETFSSYVLAIHARKGNVVGRVVQHRTIAPELAVNELYNALLDDPANHQLAAQVSVDVLFAAFEKFVKLAWSEAMGPIVPQQNWVEIQIGMERPGTYAGNFESLFKKLFNEMAPQNQRAFRATIRLLAELLDGTGNDSDRGILTAAFTDVLVPHGNPHDYMHIIDRLIEDMEVLFGEPRPTSSDAHQSLTSSVSSDSRNLAKNTGSLTSNTSLRKRFGFGLTRENSKAKDDHHESSGFGSVWRSLSKTKSSSHDNPTSPQHGSTASQPSSLSKAHNSFNITRSKSTDVTALLSLEAMRRPSSRDRPTVLGAFPFEGSGCSTMLTTIGENISTTPISSPPRKKRRSSLSDLRALQVESSGRNTPVWDDDGHPSPRVPSPLRTSAIPLASARGGSPARVGSPLRSGSSIRSASPNKKENNPLSPTGLPRPAKVPRPPSSKGDDPSQNPSKRRSESISNIPRYGPGSNTHTRGQSIGVGGLAERPTSGNIAKRPPLSEKDQAGNGNSSFLSASSSPRKSESVTPSIPPTTPVGPPRRLKMQSPTKLRERLQGDQKSLRDAESALQSELEKISQEMQSLGTPGSVRVKRAATASASHSLSTLSGAASDSPDPMALKRLETRVATLESRIRGVTAPIQQALAALSNDYHTSLQVSEARVKHLDQLYRDASAENDALYSKFNEELERVLSECQKGNAAREASKRREELIEEAARLKRENARLKREVGGLRAQLR